MSLSMHAKTDQKKTDSNQDSESSSLSMNKSERSMTGGHDQCGRTERIHHQQVDHFETHSTKGTAENKWSTRRIAIYALFVALTMVLSYLSIPFPMASFLKYDPSGIAVLVSGFAFGPSAALIVSILGFLPHFFSNPFGALINILVALALSLPSSLIYQRFQTRKGAGIGILVGALAGLVMAILCNVIITPFYAHMSFEQVLAIIIPVLLPFNLMKFALNGIVTFMIYKPISVLISR